jgi:hypothetical protein
MKKVKIAIALLSLVALVGFNLFVNLTDSTDPSTLLLDNVEALADGEIENYYNFKLNNEGSCKICQRENGYWPNFLFIGYFIFTYCFFYFKNSIIFIEIIFTKV